MALSFWANCSYYLKIEKHICGCKDYLPSILNPQSTTSWRLGLAELTRTCPCPTWHWTCFCFGALAVPMHSICQALTELALSCSQRPGHWNIPWTFWNQQKHKYIKTNQQLSHAPWTFQNLSSLKKRYYLCLQFYTYYLSSILLTQGVSSDNKQHQTTNAWKPSLQLQGSWKQPRPLWSCIWHGTRGQTGSNNEHIAPTM